jgi:hypothetical protein
VIGDPILVDPTEVRERCECHVCETLRGVLAANLDAVHDRRSVTPMLLTVPAAAELLGVSDGTVAGPPVFFFRRVRASREHAAGPAPESFPAREPGSRAQLLLDPEQPVCAWRRVCPGRIPQALIWAIPTPLVLRLKTLAALRPASLLAGQSVWSDEVEQALPAR